MEITVKLKPDNPYDLTAEEIEKDIRLSENEIGWTYDYKIESVDVVKSDQGDSKMNAKEWEIELLHRYNEANGDYQDYVCLTLDEAKEILMLLKDLARIRVKID